MQQVCILLVPITQLRHYARYKGRKLHAGSDESAWKTEPLRRTGIWVMWGLYRGEKIFELRGFYEELMLGGNILAPSSEVQEVLTYKLPRNACN